MKKKTHPNYNVSKDPEKNGGKFGYLGCPENAFTDQELKDLGEGVVDWISEEGNIWIKYFFALKGIHWNTVEKLKARSPMFMEYIQMAKIIQESKLVSEPYDQRKKKDANHARFILARHHKQEWEEKPQIITEEQEKKLDTANEFIKFLQSKSDLNMTDSNISNADKSMLETGE